MGLAVLKLGYIDNIMIEVNVCLEGERQLCLVEVVGSGFAVCVEDRRHWMIRYERFTVRA